MCWLGELIYSLTLKILNIAPKEGLAALKSFVVSLYISSVHHLFINTHFVSKCIDRNKLLKAMTSDRVVLWVFGWQVVLAFIWSLYILMYLFMLSVTHRSMLFWCCSLGSMVELREVIKQPWLLTSLWPFFFKADISIVWEEPNMVFTKVSWGTDKAVLSQSFI